MSDYSQITFFAPKDALPTGNPSKLIKGTEVDAELAAIATAILSKFDSTDIASDAVAGALTSNAVLMSPAKVKYALENGTFDLATGVTKDGLALVLGNRTVTAGSGLTGGGALSANITLNVGAGTGISVGADVVNLDINALTDLAVAADPGDFVPFYDVSGAVVKKVSVANLIASTGYVPTGRILTAGTGLTGGGDLSADRTFALANTAVVPGAYGNSANVGSFTVDAQGRLTAAANVAILHDSLSGFVANEHIDHSLVSITAGTGLTGGGTIAASRSLALDTANSRNADHSAISIVAGNGLTGGGTIAANRTLDVGAGAGIAVAADSVALDISGLTSVQGNTAIGTDSYLFNDGGVMKQVTHQNAGLPVETVAATSDTLASNNANTFIRYTAATAVSVTLNTGVGVVGNIILLQQGGAGQVTVAGTATINGATGLKTRTQHSVIALLCVAANTWVVYGDAAA